MQFDNPVTNRIPVPKSVKDKQGAFIQKADQMLAHNNGFKNLRNGFTNLLLSKFEIEKLSRKLQSWHELSFKQFLKELKKKKVELSLDKEAEWLEYFTQQKALADELKSQIVQTDKEIDVMVYELYGLTEEEIRVVES